MPLPATHELHIYGSINGHEFDMVGGGDGNPKDGHMQTNVKSTKGPLAFSPYIVTPHLGYGFYQYLPFPNGEMSPFQAAMQDGGYEIHRTFRFEDGAMLSANYKYFFDGTHIKGEFCLTGSGFPANGPVMTSAITGVDDTVSRMVPLDNNMLFDAFSWGYRTSSGKTYEAMVNTNYQFGKPIPAGIKSKLPMFVFRKLDIKVSKTEVTLVEWQKAFSEPQ
ncbi:PREDICTED: GFP-like fluorescent chromoprotein amFP486 [Branchiostoma belcheri]|uniref:GFP-like fluorescent chromoprotein amFP486 n=1 Tax=Branchiostoma belcheri TaxID=7741 RepID=A0A6P5AUX2_BRABE|nr:PREDICTED: GFP-like fluorescent chromoprotein amFP486 [Branchiostoma belcheri]